MKAQRPRPGRKERKGKRGMKMKVGVDLGSVAGPSRLSSIL